MTTGITLFDAYAENIGIFDGRSRALLAKENPQLLDLYDMIRVDGQRVGIQLPNGQNPADYCMSDPDAEFDEKFRDFVMEDHVQYFRNAYFAGRLHGYMQKHMPSRVGMLERSRRIGRTEVLRAAE